MRPCARTLPALAAPLMLAACATMAPPQPPSLDLPKPTSDLRATRKGDRVILTWTPPTTTTDRQTIRTLGATEICRSVTGEMQTCGAPIGKSPGSKTTPSKKQPPTSYVDSLSSSVEGNDPSAFATYAVQVLNTDVRSAGLSNQVHVPLIHTLPPPQDFRAQVAKQGVVLSWKADVPSPPAGVRYVFRLFRQAVGQQPSTMGEVAGGSDTSYTFTDSQIEWEKTYDYRAEAVTVISQPGKPDVQVEGDDTAVVKVFTHDVFPPAVPTGLQAAFSGPGQQPFIDLVWAPVSDIDLAGYNVYRHTDGSAAIKITSELVKTPAYRDTNVQPGTRFYYSVTAVDLRGNESTKSEEASESVPQ